MEESVNLVYEKLKDLEERISNVAIDIRQMKDNHLHDLDLRLTKMETSLSIGWKAIICVAGIPSVLSTILSLVQMMK